MNEKQNTAGATAVWQGSKWDYNSFAIRNDYITYDESILESPLIGNEIPLAIRLERARTIVRNGKGSKFASLYDHGIIPPGKTPKAALMSLLSLLTIFMSGDKNMIRQAIRASVFYKSHARSCMVEDANLLDKAIDDAIAFVGKEKYWKPPGRPSGNIDKEGKEILTIEVLRHFLEFTLAYGVRYNDMLNELDVIGLENYVTASHAEEILFNRVYDRARLSFDKVNEGHIKRSLLDVALQNRYHPVIELVNSVTWDGKDRLVDIFAALKITENTPDHELSRTLVKKWLWQCISLIHNGFVEGVRLFGADGILVFQCVKEGIGKTSFFRHLAMVPEFFEEGKEINPENKDSLMEAVNCWIVELGEIESTFKKDNAKLKAVITRISDTYRKPYAATSWKIPRRSSWCGTCNSLKFLVEHGENRRFWTIPIDPQHLLDLEKIKNIDALQVWAQAMSWIKDVSGNICPKLLCEGFRLTVDERARLEQRNAHHERTPRAYEEIADLIGKAEMNDGMEFKMQTVTDFKMHHGVLLARYSVKEIVEALAHFNRLVPKKAARNGDSSLYGNKSGRYLELPYRALNNNEYGDWQSGEM